MSDLQIGLALLGALIVAGVLVFNWWQERKFRQRAAATFPGGHDDVLLQRPFDTAQAQGQDARDEPRIESRIEPHLDAASEASSPRMPAAARFSVTDLPQPEIDYIVEIRAGEFIPVEKLARLHQGLPGLSRRISFSGLNHQLKSWEGLTADGARYTSVRAGLQLVDRSGPVNEEQVRQFGDAARTTAGEMAAIAQMPEFAPALKQAAELDAFCADVDVLVGINVIAHAGQVFHGTKIRALAEAAGLHLQPGGIFHCNDEHGATLFTVDNQEPEPFLIDRIRGITTPGITFLLDVPRVANGLRVFDRMVAMSRSFAESLDGSLADDNRALLNDAGLDRIRQQLRAIHATMEQRGIEAGSPLALRLFS
jgi:FtsZ-interacting cell division protein ZipA